jgi:hypothetical protein
MMNTTRTPDPCPIETPTTPAGKTAVRLHADWTRKFARAAEIDQERGTAIEAQSEADKALQQALVEAENDNGGKPTKSVKDAQTALDAATAKVEEPWMKRLQAAYVAAEQARGEYERHVSENFDEILSEPGLDTAAEGARSHVIVKIREAEEAFRAWQDVANKYQRLLGIADGIDGQAIPRPTGAAEDLWRALRKFEHSPDSLPLPKPKRTVLEHREALLGGTASDNMPARHWRGRY